MSKKFRIGIRTQILALMVILMWVVAGVNGYFSITSQRENLIQERKMRGMAVLSSWAALCRERLVSGDATTELSMYDFMDGTMKNEKGLQGIFVQDESGKILLANDPKLNGKSSPDTLFPRLLYAEHPGVFEIYKHGERYLQFYSPIYLDKKRFGVARMILNSAGIEEGLREMMLRLIIATIAVVGVGLFFTILILMKITSPISVLTRGVEEFGKRFNPSKPETADYKIEFRSNNELGEVRDAFNEMTKTLKASLDDKVRLKKEATVDAMTGLLNKRQFQEDYPAFVANAKDHNKILAMMMVDMDKFKVLNDTVGHKAGDKALQDVAACMTEKVRGDDRAYRVGGDEFVIILPGATAGVAHDRSLQISKEYDDRKAPENMTGISFGIVEYDGKESPEEFFQRADAEMYRVKKEKKGTAMKVEAIWRRLCMVVGFFLTSAFGGSFLTNISWMESPDSLEIRMVFSGDLPEKYRVSLVRDSLEGFMLTAGFLGADTSKNMFVGGVVPQWFHVQVEQDRGKMITRLLLPIKQEVPYRAEWKANHFHLVLPNVLPKDSPIWKNPWVYLGVGAVTVGGAVLWLTTSKTPTPKDETIDPPDIDLPE